ncbi:MAG: DNA primase noncatalytic subunit PriX [Candidatus Nitrosopolaris sp.]
MDRQIEEAERNTTRRYWGKCKGKNNRAGTKNTIGWIEKLLNTPIEDSRKYTIKFILARYLMNIRGLPHSDASDMLSSWLNRCDSVCNLRDRRGTQYGGRLSPQRTE